MLFRSFNKKNRIAPFEAMHDKIYRSHICWVDVCETKLLNLEILLKIIRKIQVIRKRLGTVQSRKTNYTYRETKMLKFEVGDHIFLKMSPSKGITRFGKYGKLNPQHVCLFQILERVGNVAYRVTPKKLSNIHIKIRGTSKSYIEI